MSYRSEFVQVGDLKLHYLTAGEGPPVLLLHGWPTSSFLWRDTIAPMARHNRVLALDLPGFGKSDKPLDVRYTFGFYSRAIEGFLEAVGADHIGLAVHDLGGPVGLYWAVNNLERVRKLALLNTLVYSKPSWAVVLFVLWARLPLLRSYLTSVRGLAFGMRYGVADKSKITAEVLRGVQEPFQTKAARKALLKSVYNLNPKRGKLIPEVLPQFKGPVRVIYGAVDRILPDVAKTMARIARDLPQTETTCFEDCGHFLQEERGPEIGELLAEFFAETGASAL